MSAQALKILIVEDELGILEEVADFLRRRRYDVQTSADLGSARRTLADYVTLPDVVLTDVRLPDGDGLDLVSELSARTPIRPRLIVMTGHLDPVAVDDAHERGAEAVLLKPFALRALLQHINGDFAVAGSA